ncbi:major facilitator superfamily domain-containing protein [Coemansia spiralis]|nr:major facilitator superfamily domain-containing protein [Coemansia spiralis]
MTLGSTSTPSAASAGQESKHDNRDVEVAVAAAANNDSGDNTGYQEPNIESISHFRYALVLISASLFCLAIGYDFTAVASVMPTIGIYLFKQSIIDLVAVVFLLSLSVLIPTLMRLGDFFGHRLVLLFSGALHISGLLMSGAANKMPLLLAGRAIAGIGAAGTLMTSIIAVSRLENKRQRVWGQRIVLVMSLIGSVIGFAIGSALATINSWHWVFYAETPCLAVALVLGVLAFNPPKLAGRLTLLEKLKRIDVLGTLFLAGSAVSLILAINKGDKVSDLTSDLVIALLAVAVVLFIGFILVERYVAFEPLLPLSMINSDMCALIAWIQGFLGATIFPLILYQVTWYHTVKNVSAKKSAIYVMPVAIAALVLSLATEFVVSSWRRLRTLISVSAVFLLLGTILVFCTTESTSNTLPIVYMALFGIGIGTSIQPYIVILRDISTETTASVIGCVLFLRYFGAVVGITVFNVLVQMTLVLKNTETIIKSPLYSNYILDSRNNEDVIRLPKVPQSVRNDVLYNNYRGFRAAYGISLACVIIAVVLCFPLVFRSLFKRVPMHRRSSNQI